MENKYAKENNRNELETNLAKSLNKVIIGVV